MPKIILYRTKCIGCNVCYEMWPLRWRISRTDGKSTLVNSVKKKDVFISEISLDELEINQEISEVCPAKIIKVEL